MTKHSLVSAGLTACLLGAGFTGLAAATATAAAPFEPSAHRGQLVYQKACAACHGETGKGDGQGAKPLDPKPRDFTSGLYKFRSTGLGDMPTDADLMRVIENGVPTTQMPGFKNVLTAQERADVAAYIKLFAAEDFGYADFEVIDIPEAPATTAEFVAEGKNVFMALDCWTCHGAGGKGDGNAAKGLKDSWGFAIKPHNLTRTSYKNGATPEDIYRTIHTGFNGTPMSAFGGAFVYGSDRTVNEDALATAYSRAEIDALKAYLAAQPTQAAVRALDDDAQTALTERRKWALVHYVRSLQKKPGILGWLTEDTEVTR